MKLIWCNGFAQIYAQLEEGGWGQTAIGICVLCYIYIKLIWCNGCPDIYAQLEEGVGSICHRYMSIVLYIYETYFMQWFSRDLCSI